MIHVLSLYLAPALYSLFLWWFLTGLIMAFYGREPGTVRWAFVGATAVLLLAAAGVVITRQYTHTAAVYGAFTCGTLVWAWLIAGYYLGYITGPDVAGLPRPPRAIQDSRIRLRLALQASLYHELLVLAVCLVLVWLTWSSANRLALWTFLALWIMHGISKLNVLFGVRNFHIEWLPRHMHRLGSLLVHRPVNPLFPWTMLLASLTVWALVARAVAPETGPSQTVALVLIGFMIFLGMLEQMLLVLPLPAVLWGWRVRLLPGHVRAHADVAPHATNVLPAGSE